MDHSSEDLESQVSESSTASIASDVPNSHAENPTAMARCGVEGGHVLVMVVKRGMKYKVGHRLVL